MDSITSLVSSANRTERGTHVCTCKLMSLACTWTWVKEMHNTELTKEPNLEIIFAYPPKWPAVFSPRIVQGGHDRGVGCGHIKALGLCPEGLQG